MTNIKILKVDMRANDHEVIQNDLQEQIDKIERDYEILGDVRPLPSPNTALQCFIVTCKKKGGIKSGIKPMEGITGPSKWIMNYRTVKIGAKGFKSYYFPIANFLEDGESIKVVALGKRVQMAAYLCSIIQKHGARLVRINISTVELPASETEYNEKIVDVVMLEVFVERYNFMSRIKYEGDKERKYN